MSNFALDHRIRSNAEVRLLNVMAHRSGRKRLRGKPRSRFSFIINAKNDELGPHNADYVPREAYNQTKYNMDMKKAPSIFSPISPSDTYMIYDQFHLKRKDHFSEKVRGWDSALSRYNFHKTFHPECCLGLCTVEYYDHLMNMYS